MKRAYFIQGDSGPRKVTEADFPLTIGGAACDIKLQGIAHGRILAHVALSGGHAYVQPASEHLELFHNHEYLTASAWLKSGDRVQFGEQEVCWDIKGDQVLIRVEKIHLDTGLTPPGVPPPGNGNGAQGDQKGHDTEEILPVGAPPLSPVRRRKLRNLLLALFTLLLIAAMFVIFATPISVTILPEPDSQSVSGFPPPVGFGGKKLVVPGVYAVHATRKGYHPLEESFEVASNGFQAFTFELEELPGRLKINVDPDVPVRVLVQDAEIAVEPGNIIALERGVQLVSVTTQRYLEERCEVEIAGFGALQELNITLRPAWADVHFDSQPRGAQVLVDGVPLGVTPLDTGIIRGRREIRLELAGHKPLRFSRQFEAGIPVSMEDLVLEPNDGILLLETRPSGATVSVDGKYSGSSPLELVLASGASHQLNASKPGYLAVTKDIVLAPDEEQKLVLDLPPEYGIVFSSSSPADADLEVDGRPAGKGTQRLRLTTRPHELTFSKPGYVPQTVKVVPRNETSQNVDVVLKTAQQAREEARPELLRTAAGQQMPLIEPQGPFEMGASRREAGRRANESQRLVQLTRAYYLSGKEVTNAEYRKFKQDHASGSAEGVSLNGDSMPVVNVSWDDAARYCNWLSEQDELPPSYVEQDGRMVLSADLKTGYRLPTEAEWAYAARVVDRDSQARYPWGEGYPPAANAGNYADAQIADTLANVVTGYNDGFRGPAPVGSFPAMPAGFHDLGGNVAEWTNDFYAVYPGQAERLVKDPMGPASGDHHVVRGSSWRDGSITELRLSYRDYSRGPRDNLGFRIARYADE